MPTSVFKTPHESRERILDLWYQTPLGKAVFQLEINQLENNIRQLFGYHLLQIGALGRHAEALKGIRTKHTHVLSNQIRQTTDLGWVQADSLQLPIASHSIDVVLLAHSLDFSDDPHRLLREIERILIPEGRVIILGFNPFSSWGIRQLFSRKKRIPWSAHFISRHRVIDWLALLGLELEQQTPLFLRPPVKSQPILQLMKPIETIRHRFIAFFSGIYCIQAVKKEITLTPIDPTWKLSADFIGRQIIKPAMRSLLMSDRVVIYTDGACKGNPGPGGWGALLQYKGTEKEVCGGEANTTNNRMEIMAVIGALGELKRSARLQIITDSKYVKNGINQWIHNWKKNGWLTAAKKPVKNSDLWKQLDTLIAEHDVEWKWVKGHSGNVGNERADKLANDGIDQMKKSS